MRAWVVELFRAASGALKLDVDFVTHRNSRCPECRAAHADAEAAASNEHRAPGEGDAIERAGHPHLTAATELAGQLDGNVDHRQATRPVLVPAADTTAEQCHDPPQRTRRSLPETGTRPSAPGWCSVDLFSRVCRQSAMPPAVTAIKGSYRVFHIFLAVFGGGLAITPVLPGGPKWATDLAVRIIWPTAVTLVTAGCVARAWRMGLYASDEGVLVRNFFRAYRFSWGQIRCLDDGHIKGFVGKGMSVLVVVLNDGTAVNAWGSGDNPRGEALEAVVSMARRYGVPYLPGETVGEQVSRLW